MLGREVGVNGVVVVDLPWIPENTWSVMFLPTDGRLTRVGMPRLVSSAGSPIPESIRSCGVLNTPALTITSLRARLLATFDLVSYE
jgi:hypothetical protein